MARQVPGEPYTRLSAREAYEMLQKGNATVIDHHGHAVLKERMILGAGFVFGWEQALYALIALYVSGIVAETTFEGRGTVRTALIVTSAPDTVSRQIIDVLGRGVTIVPAIGGYTGEARSVLYCVVSRSEIVQLKAIVHEADPKAFMVVGQAHEALGEGFRPLE